MTLQSTVNIDSKFGIPGELIFNGPQRVESVIVNSNASSANNIGAAYTRNAATGVAQVGGVAGPGTCSVTASIAVTTGIMTVTAVSAGMPSIGQTITGASVPASTTITGYISVNNDGTGTYQTSTTTAVASTTITGTGGSNLVFGGILANPKQQASLGTTAGTLAPTLAIPDNTQADLLYMGTIVLSTSTACNIGDQLVYNILTGAISTVAPGATPGANTRAVPNGVVFRYPTSAAGLIAGKLTN